MKRRERVLRMVALAMMRMARVMLSLAMSRLLAVRIGKMDTEKKKSDRNDQDELHFVKSENQKPFIIGHNSTGEMRKLK